MKKIYILLSVLTYTFLLSNCSKKTDTKPPTAAPTVPTIITIDISSITSYSALCGGEITSDGGSPITARGVIWSTDQNLSISLSTKTSDSAVGGSNSYTSYLSGLSANTTYYLVAYATNSVGTAYSSQLSFKTGTSTFTPTLTTMAISNTTATNATSGGNITSDGGSAVTSRGIVWSTSPNPTIALATKTNDGTGTGTFTSNLSGLTPNTSYYVVAYATNSNGTNYGSQVNFKTSIASIPTLTTLAVSNVTAIGFTGGGNITSDGGSPITDKGVIWSIAPNPTIKLATKMSMIANDGTGTGVFTGSNSTDLEPLAPNTSYYLVSYATNAVGTAYGNQIIFKTSSIQTLSTTVISNITGTAALSGGNITTNGITITAKGVIWSTSPNPTVALPTKTNDVTSGIGGGSFTSNLSGLMPNTTYYVEAYATSSFGTAYGNQISFTTSAMLPTLSPTTVIQNITSTSVDISGPIVTSDGGSPITDQGIVWSTNPNPTIALSTKISAQAPVGTGRGPVFIGGLTPNTTYYVVIYATNSVGTTYDTTVTFNTL